ncbi:MAG: hypothetical protein WCP67_06720 [Verrucomicrobiota bacterium]|jgi:hypothetical protein
MTPLIIVLGPAGSGRSILLKELIENAWPAGKQVRTFRHSSDAPTDHPATDFWTLTEGQAVLPAPGTEDAAILVSDGRGSVVDQMESLHRALYGSTQWQIQRIVTVLDCTLAHRHPVAAEWYGAAVHFADAVIVTRRWEVPGQWLSKYLATYTDAFYPCLFVNLLKNGSLANPAEVIEGEPLRMSHIFDEIDAVDEMEFDEDNLPDEPFDLVRQPDKYFARDDYGRRLISVPDIAETLRVEGR